MKKPSALLVTISRYKKVTRVLRDLKADHDFPGIKLDVEPAADFDDVPRLMRTPDLDLIALDGHGRDYGESAYFGLHCEELFCPEYLRGSDGAGIVAPIIVLGFCCGGKDPFISALEGSLGRSNAAFLGSTKETGFRDAEDIYLPILRLLPELGSTPDPATAHARLATVAPGIGEAWRSVLLSRRNDPR